MPFSSGDHGVGGARSGKIRRKRHWHIVAIPNRAASFTKKTGEHRRSPVWCKDRQQPKPPVIPSLNDLKCWHYGYAAGGQPQEWGTPRPDPDLLPDFVPRPELPFFLAFFLPPPPVTASGALITSAANRSRMLCLFICYFFCFLFRLDWVTGIEKPISKCITILYAADKNKYPSISNKRRGSCAGFSRVEGNVRRVQQKDGSWLVVW